MIAEDVRAQIDRIRRDGACEPTLIVAGRSAWHELFESVEFVDETRKEYVKGPTGLVGWFMGIPVIGVDTRSPHYCEVFGRNS